MVKLITEQLLRSLLFSLCILRFTSCTPAKGIKQMPGDRIYYTKYPTEIKAVQKWNSDTLVITSPSIKFIRVGSKVYEVKRVPEVLQVNNGTADSSNLQKEGKLRPYTKEEQSFIGAARSIDDYMRRQALVNKKIRQEKKIKIEN